MNYTPTSVGGFLIHRLDFSPLLRSGAEVKSPKALIRAVPALHYRLFDYHKLIFFLIYNFCITRLQSCVLEVEYLIKLVNICCSCTTIKDEYSCCINFYNWCCCSSTCYFDTICTSYTCNCTCCIYTRVCFNRIVNL